jgi:hypothetical protein
MGCFNSGFHHLAQVMELYHGWQGKIVRQFLMTGPFKPGNKGIVI